MTNSKGSFDITALGECLIDFVQQAEPEGALGFIGNPGGAPPNLLAGACKFGLRCAFIGKVGDDAFGRKLIEQYSAAGIYTGAMRVSGRQRTTLAFVTLDEKGDRDFLFYRNGTADCMLNKDEVDAELIRRSRVFHFGSISMTSEASREATLYAISAARESGAVVSFDPNYRPLLWRDRGEAKEAIAVGAGLADIIKVSEEELPLLSGRGDMREAAGDIIERYGPALVVVTRGRDGAFCLAETGLFAEAPAYTVETIDTTGAGDAFFGAFLAGFLRCGKPLGELDGAELEGILKMAAAAGSLSTTRYGAIPAMPSEEEVNALLGSER